MAGSALWATPEQLYVASNAAKTIAGDIQGYVARVNGQVATLMGSWRGTAPPAFQAQHQSWNDTMTKLIHELERVSDATRRSADAQRTADEDSTAAVGRVGPGPVSTALAG
ncbi:WXG100 family type VII secretion target [Actinophytocola sp.]|jgi:WXG100 family type VII secretion target|uniref:WXG100 family type VII secretion target n=1 Tax=Actinophytocola sp. TaxID=1872138 RepID=UPI002ED86225